MSDSRNNFSEARKLVRDFETENEPERLREASSALINVRLEREYDSNERHQLRSECLYLWLTILNMIDVRIDPSFDPADVPPKNIEPPSSDDEAFRPGVEPAKIADPKIRADYEKAVDENRSKQINYRIQVKLRRLDERVSPMAEEFVRRSYTTSENDRSTVGSAIEAVIKSSFRKDRLNKLLESDEE